MVEDQIGVLNAVTAILRDHDISVESMLQKGRSDNAPVHLVFTTHATNQQAVEAACDSLRGASFIAGDILSIANYGWGISSGHQMDAPKPTQFVEASLSGAVWYLQGSVYSMPETQRRAEGLAKRMAMPPGLSWYLTSNGIDSEGMDGFLSPRLRDSLPDPHIMQDAKKAIALICNAIELKQPIGIFGDYDVDGAVQQRYFARFCPDLAVLSIVIYPIVSARGMGRISPHWRAKGTRGRAYPDRGLRYYCSSTAAGGRGCRDENSGH